MSDSIRRLGFWTAVLGAALGLGYLGLLVAAAVSGSLLPPAEPYLSAIHVLTLLTAPAMVFFWAVVHTAAPREKKVFSLASLVLIGIFAALTSINRYVALTVVPQAYALGVTNGVEWFLPYGWPSVMAAIELLAWGFFMGLACLCLAPVFTPEKRERAIFWTLLLSGVLCLLAPLGQMIRWQPLSMLGVLGWGPGLTIALVLIAIWFRQARPVSLPEPGVPAGNPG